MIFWFSGTGNSKWVAQQLASALGERLASVADALVDGTLHFSLHDGERLGFVFPIYSWGPAPVVTELVEKVQFSGTPDFCFMVATCGDDVGLSAQIMKAALAKRGITLHSAHSVQMPNTYINMPGFDVDSDRVRTDKLHSAPERVREVVQDIVERKCIEDVVRGRLAWVKSHIVRPWFLKHAMGDRKFAVDDELCSHCGACVNNCPMRNITLTDEKQPQWNGRCAMCLSCLHRCPTCAIQYGKATKGKGRYFFMPSETGN